MFILGWMNKKDLFTKFQFIGHFNCTHFEQTVRTFLRGVRKLYQNRHLHTKKDNPCGLSFFSRRALATLGNSSNRWALATLGNSSPPPKKKEKAQDWMQF